MKQNVSLKELVDLVDRIESDEEQLDSALRRRDRPVGRELSALKDRPLAQLVAWLERITEGDAPTAGSRVASAMHIGTLLLALCGLLVGGLTAAAVFYYDGSHPVNIINALAVFVGFQLLLLLFTCLTFLPDSILRLIPLMRSVKEIFRLFSPGRLLGVFHRFLPARYKDAVSTFTGRTAAHRTLYGRVEKWLIVRAGQVFGVGFNLGALAGCLYLVIFSDLAFGWSTTLQTEAGDLMALTDGLARPWAWLIPEAQPSLALIEATRYFRFQSGTLPGFESGGPAILGEWWPFLILCLLIYGLLPRLVTLSVASSRLQRACRHTMLNLPGARTILDRLNSQLVETRADQPETALDTPLESNLQGRFAGEFRGQPVTVIDWGATGLSRSAVEAWLENTWGATLDSFSEAGGAFSIEHDRRVLSSVSDRNAGPVVLLVKSWEPPMAEFKDFVHDLRQALAEPRPVAVVPVGVGSETEPLPPQADMAAVWATVVKQLGDPWTFVARPDQPREEA